MPDADPSLRPRLQAALGAGVILDRELPPEGEIHAWVASDTRAARLLLVQVIPAFADVPAAERFVRELRRGAALEHDNVLPIRTAGHAAGTPYWVSPLVAGESLRGRLDTGRALDAGDAAEVLADVARALVHAHERGGAHLELTAGRVLLTPGRALVADFGVGRALRAVAGEEGAAAADALDDIEGWGAIAHEVVASAWRRTGAAAADDPRPPAPAGLAELVAQCLDPDPAARPASMREVLERLERITAPPPAPVEVIAGRMRALPRASEAPGRLRGVLLTLALAAAAVAAVFLLLRALG